MHTVSMKDSDGSFSDGERSDCWHCGGKDTLVCRAWDSSCGGYTDYQYRCEACGKRWWSEGPDA